MKPEENPTVKDAHFKNLENILLDMPSSFLMSNNHLAKILHAAKLNLWELDLIKNEVFDFGYSESLSILDKNDKGPGILENFYARVHPGDVDRVKSSFEDSVKNHEDFESEFRIHLINGNCEWIDARGCTTYQDNIPVKVVGTWRIITDEKKAQQMMRLQHKTLDRLSRAYFVGQFASTMVHEISQPLVAINTYISASLRRLKINEITTTELVNVLELSEYLLKTINQIITRIRSFIISGDLKQDEINIESLIKSALKLIRFTHGNIITIKLEFEDKLPILVGDHYQIMQVMYSLINNAIEAMNGEAITEPKLIIRVNTNKNMMNISIIDNGKGIVDEFTQLLFMPFFTTKEDGMGFGLAICRNIIEAHHGTIEIREYQEGNGTICCFSLPLPHNEEHVS